MAHAAECAIISSGIGTDVIWHSPVQLTAQYGLLVIERTDSSKCVLHALIIVTS